MKKMFFLALAAILLFSIPAGAQTQLKRKAQHGFTLSKIAGALGATVVSVVANSPASRSGLVAGDRVLAINGTVFTDVNNMLSQLRTLRGGVPVTLRVLKKTSPALQSITFTPLPAPLETYTSLSLEPVVLTNDWGMPLRGFVTRPKVATGKLPAILFVSWLSCGTVEARDTSDSWIKMLRDVAERSGCLLLRLEKPGVGDSEGRPCADTDLQTELIGYEAALRYLKSRDDVDTTRIILFGGSIGGTLTAHVGRGHAIKAYVSAVSVYKTWFEHMIELERRRVQLSGTTPANAAEAMRAYTALYTDYLLYHKTPLEIIREKPHLEKWWYDEPRHQYGRPAAFYHQLQEQNFFGDWSTVRAPVLLIAGEYDWIMSPDDHQILQHMLNQRQPGQCTLHIGRGMDHHWNTYRSAQDAFNEKGGSYDQETVNFLIAWVRKQVA